MEINIGLYSYGAACAAYLLLSGALLLVWRNRSLSVYVILATVMTAVWAGLVAFGTLTTSPPLVAIQLMAVSRDAVWLFLLLSIYADRGRGKGHLALTGRNWLPWFMAGVALATVATFILLHLGRVLDLPRTLTDSAVYCIRLTMSLLGILTMENIYRNNDGTSRAWIKFLCIGVGTIFLYDFFLYANALISQKLSPALWLSRGFVVAFSAPLIATAVVRSRDRRGLLKFSHHVVFHTFTLMAAGTYLISMTMVNYFIDYLGVSWGEVLQVTYISGSLILLVALFASRRVRGRARVWLSKNFFSYKYDYRLEWVNFTDTLEEGRPKMNTPQAIVQAMAVLAECDAGLLWMRQANGQYELSCEWRTVAQETGDDYSLFFTWLCDTGWVIDVTEWREHPQRYSDLQLPQEFAEAPGDWLVVPLVFSQGLEGAVVLRRISPYVALNWEDRDLLKVAGRQAASHLAQYQASLSVTEMRQFEAFHRLSAYVVHDLKNILTEQSLIVSNAARHRDNPAFFDDVIATVEDSVERMTRLMSQMHSGTRTTELSTVDLCKVLREAVAAHSAFPPVPTLIVPDSAVWVEAEREQLLTVFGHIIQNAKEATSKTGAVSVRLEQQEARAVVEIADNGIGMSQTFIKDRLFKPFDSTKGLTGMGMGAFESREVLRSVRGGIRVNSTEGSGSTIIVDLPLRHSALQQN